MDINVKEIESAQSTKIGVKAAAANGKEKEASKKKEEVEETEKEVEPAESHAKQEMLCRQPGGEAEELWKETEENVHSSAEECFEGSMKCDEDCGMNPNPNIVSRARGRSLATSLEKDFKLKVSCQVEGGVEIEDAGILLAPSSRRAGVQVNEKFSKQYGENCCNSMYSNINNICVIFFHHHYCRSETLRSLHGKGYPSD